MNWWASIRRILAAFFGLAIRAALLVAAFIIIKRACFIAYDYGYRVFSEAPVTEGEGINKVVEIPIGSSSMEIGEILEENGLIRDSKLFFIQELLSAYRGDLQPGTYTLNTSMTSEEMMRILAGVPDEEGEEEKEDGTG